ncbi:MAG: hypothetical protein NZM09_10160 [Ignavibacterium sp.]|nr:hypothetical protein [Ignavibacterium sp.]MDW8376042.1 hypothetical protein [Ignavibacteriales bacterium]
MKQVYISKFFNCTKQNINKRLKKRKKNANKKFDTGEEIKLFSGDNGRRIIQPLLYKAPINDDKDVQQNFRMQQR